jgi:DNA polymerase III subunit epsilon
MNFIALDLETANSCQSTICQIGLVQVANSEFIATWESMLNPESPFDFTNVGIHGIRPSMVSQSPTFPQLHKTLEKKLNGNIIVHHTAFDRIAIQRVCDKYDLPHFDVEWLDSAKIVRRSMPQFSKRGYGLKNVATHFGYDFNHHDALEDAKAAAFVTIKCCELTGIPVSQIKY